MEWSLLIVVLGPLVWAAWIYNRLVGKRNRVATAWSDIDVQLTRRHDLIPNLVRVVQRYTDHERGTLEKVTRLRSQALETSSPKRLGELETDLEQLLGRLLILKEDYPDLRASENFHQLSEQLVEVEEQLQFARRYYNGSVRDLNTAVEQFPDLLVARLFRFRQAEFYSAEAGHRIVPTLDAST